jgi:uncharacterized protein (TIGR02996 family)
MVDLDALYEAVVSAPTSDAPREVYAEAIAASDPDRAEYIRLELQLARWRRTGPISEERTHASVRAQILLGRHRPDWEATVKPLVDGCGFLRGFVELVRMDAGRFLATAPVVYRAAPVLHLELSGVKPVAADLFASPYLARIESLGLLRNELGDHEVALLAGSPHLGRLAWLNLGLNEIGEAGLEALAASDHLPRLGYVSLMSNPVDDPTPRHADGYDATSPVALALQERYGRRDWLDARERANWPPDRDAVKEPLGARPPRGDRNPLRDTMIPTSEGE